MGIYGTRDGKFSVKKIEVVDKIAMQYIIPKTSAYASGAVLSAHDFNAASTALTNTALALQPPYPMNLVVCANVAGTAGHGDVITVAGEDQFGDNISENFYVKATAAGTTAGSKAFGKVDSVSIYSGQSDANTTVKTTSIGIGFSNLIGLPWPIASSGDIISYAYDGAYATTAVDALTVSPSNNTISMPANAAGKVVSVIYKTKLQK